MTFVITKANYGQVMMTNVRIAVQKMGARRGKGSSVVRNARAVMPIAHICMITEDTTMHIGNAVIAEDGDNRKMSSEMLKKKKN